MTTNKNLNTYICQFCRKPYQSDGSRKPRSFKKDGSIHQYYDSKLFCSRECLIKQCAEKYKQTLSDNPEIAKQRGKKIQQVYKNNPEMIKRSIEKRRQTLKDNPEIVKRQVENFKQTLKNNPGIIKQRAENFKQKLKNNPEIKKKATEKYKQTIKNNPEINRQRAEKSRQTYKQIIDNNPEIEVRRRKKISEKLKQTYKNNPEIIEEATEKMINTKRKNNTFNISQPEEQLYLLLKSKYSDTIRQYKDTRYPFCCDFYIPSKDLFIELQLSWTHGAKPFNEDNVECQNQLNTWKQKSLTSQFYKNAIETWTIRDVNKRQTANQNHLNYIEVFSSDFKELYDANLLNF